jgi:hypothetical protein
MKTPEANVGCAVRPGRWGMRQMTVSSSSYTGRGPRLEAQFAIRPPVVGVARPAVRIENFARD